MSYSFSLQYGTASYIYLDGSGIAAPVQGARYSPGLGKVMPSHGVQAITEEIKIDLAGTYRQIADWISALNTQLEIFKAGAWHRAVNGYLMLRIVEPDEAGGYSWTARVFDAWLTLDANGLGQRKAGQQLVSLWVTRQNFWEYSSLNSLAVNMPGGITQVSNGGLINHKDATAGHSNWGWVLSTALKGDLQSNVAMQIAPISGDYVGDFYLGFGWSDVNSSYLQYGVVTLEESDFAAGGAGVTKTPVVDANSSGGNYATYAWNNVVETLLMKATVPASLYLYNVSYERPFKPIIRLASAWAVTDCWFKAKVVVGGGTGVLYESDWVLYPGSTQILELPPVYLPPAGMEENTQIDLEIYAIKQTAGAYTMPFDFLQLWPVDGGFRKYKQLEYFASQGILWDMGFWGSAYWTDAGYTSKRASVIPYGPALSVMPGRSLIVAMANIRSGTAWYIDDQVLITIAQVQTKRNI